MARIHHAYAIANPRRHKGHGDDTWGRSAGVNAGSGFMANPEIDPALEGIGFRRE